MLTQEITQTQRLVMGLGRTAHFMGPSENQHGQLKVVDRKQVSECVYFVTDQLYLDLVSFTNVHYFWSA